MTTTKNLVLFAILLFCLVSSLLYQTKEKVGYIFLLFVFLIIYLYAYYLRLYLVSRLGLYFSDLFSCVLVFSVVSGGGQAPPLPAHQARW